MALNLKDDISGGSPILNRWSREVEAKQRELALQLARVRETADTASATADAAASDTSIPPAITSPSISQSGYIIDGVHYSEVTANYNAPSPLDNFAGVFLVVTGYRGSSEPVKVAEHNFGGAAGGTANFKVTLQRTGETVTFYFVSKNTLGGSREDWTGAPSATAALDGASTSDVFAPQNLVSATTIVTQALAIAGGALTSSWGTGNTINLPSKSITFDIQITSTNPIFHMLLWASNDGSGKPNGYYVRFDGRSGQQIGSIGKITSGVAGSSVGSAKVATNSAALKLGWYHVRVEWSTGGVLNMWINDRFVWGGGKDTTYTPTGALYYSKESGWGSMNIAPLGNLASVGTLSDPGVREGGTHVSYKLTSNPLTAIDAGATATINIAAHTNRIGGTDVSNSSGSIASLSFDTLYYIYYDDEKLAGGSVSYQATTTKTTALQGENRFFIGSIRTPLDGGADTAGNGDGGSALLGSNQVISPALGTQVNSGGSDAYTRNRHQARDRNAATFAEIVFNDDVPGVTFNSVTATYNVFQGPFLPWTSLKLKVKSEVAANPAMATGSCTLTLKYSLDGGGSYTNLFNLSAGSTRALTTDTVNLSNTQSLGLIEVVAVASGTTQNSPPTIEHIIKLYEVWIEADTG